MNLKTQLLRSKSVICQTVALCAALITGTASESKAAAGALNFNASNFIDVATVLTGGHSYTKEAWIRANASQTDNIVTGSDDPFWLSGGHLRAAHHWTGQYTDAMDTATFPLNVWVHVAVTFDSASHTMILYRDGVQVAINTNISTYSTSFEQIGAYNDSNPFDGDMDEVRIWDRAICSTELNAHKGCELQGTEKGLLVYYKFNEGLPLLGNLGLTTVLDASGHGINGVLKKFSLTGLLGNFITGVSFGNYVTYTPPTATITTTYDGDVTILTANNASAYQWLKDGFGLSGSIAQTQTLSPSPGNYSVTITAADGCKNTSDVAVVTPPITGVVVVTPTVPVPGQDENTIYPGVGTDSVAVGATGCGGTPPYNYEWTATETCTNSRSNHWGSGRYRNTDGGSSCNNRNAFVKPNTSTCFKVKITDAKGKCKTVTQTIKVKDISYGYNKVLVCHETTGCPYYCWWNCYHTKVTRYQTYAVYQWSIGSYLNAGDHLGSCGENKGGNNDIVEFADLEFKAFPNPTTGMVSLTIPEPGKTEVIVTDIMGKVLMQMIKDNTEPTVGIDLTNAAPGMYIVRVQNNDKSYSSKIVKQ